MDAINPVAIVFCVFGYSLGAAIGGYEMAGLAITSGTSFLSAIFQQARR